MPKKDESKTITPNVPIDFVIITALDEERDAMLSKLRGYKKLDKQSEDIYTYYYAEVKSQRKDKSVYKIILASPLNMGPLNATALSVTLVKKWKPQYVLLVGIACGVKGEVNYGDVMIATQVADYTLAKQVNGMRKVRWEVSPSGPSLLDSANHIDPKWINQIGQPRPTSGDVAKVKGVIASGGDVISDDEVINAYSESWPKLIGIEMESGGVAAGVHQTTDRPEFLMIKGVSDFGKDKHDPMVKPWRNYACHAAVAFTLGLIKSGPFQSSLLLKEESKSSKKEDEQKEAAERHWQYLQNHPITNIEILFFLKSPVGYKWFTDLFGDIYILFSREMKSISLREVLKESPEPNTKERDRKSNMPSSSFWEIYEHEEGFWCKRLNPDRRSFELVAGFDTTIPWGFLKTPEIINLQDLATCNDVGISFPPQVFQAGIEEIIFRIEGETYSFSVYISDEIPLAFYHEMASTFHSMDVKGDVPMNFSMRFQGLQLLDMFHKQMMPGYKRVSKKEGFMMGQSGPNGNSISFYPSMPKGFPKTKESTEYSFTINAPNEVDYKKIEKELKNKIANTKNKLDSYIKLSGLYSIQGRFQDVIKLLTAIDNQTKSNSDLYGILGNAYANLGRFNEALTEFNKAEKLAPNDPKVQFHFGLCLHGLGKDEDAIVHFKNATQLEPTNAIYFIELSRALGRLNRITDAIVPARKAVSLNPKSVENVIMLGILLNFDEQISEALTVLENATKVEPESARAYRFYATVLAKNGELEKANENFEHAIELKKEVDCYADWGRVLCDSGNWTKAETVIQDGLLIDPNHVDLLIYSGVAKANQCNFDEAIEQLEKANSLAPQDKTAIGLIEQVKSKMQREQTGTDHE